MRKDHVRPGGMGGSKQARQTMRCSLRIVSWMTLVLGVALSAGCSKPVLREKQPPDPLLTSKKPVEGKPFISDGRPMPIEDYSPPPRPLVEDESRPVRVLGVRPVSSEWR